MSMKQSESQAQNVTFSDQDDSYRYTVKGATDPTRTLMDTNDTSLEHFFSRPLKIKEYVWETGSGFTFGVWPWKEIFQNPRVANRLTNYNLLRANLHMKFVINGNSFQYGRAIASYQPLRDWDDLTPSSFIQPEDKVQFSQLPHVYLDPTTSSGGELKVPFFYHQNYYSLTDSVGDELGALQVTSINDLKHANGAADQATISIFAWLTDVSLSVLTSVEAEGITPQSGTVDEVEEANLDGFISGPATAVKNIANAIKVIPPLKPLATATSMAAELTASVAKQMGYSRPPITKAPDPYRAIAVSSLANTNVPDLAQKLTVDDKQELSISTEIAGISSTDTLNIKDIACRESYLTTFPWAQGTTSETLLWNTRVTPVIWSMSSNFSYHFPACAMAALPFKYWTGTMNFRFQFVTSAFHKGRIKVVYDPNYFNSVEYNTNYLEIIDITDKSDFTISVGNGQAYSLLEHHKPGIDAIGSIYSTGAFSTPNKGNGILSVYVVNELTTPNSTVNNDIEVNVYVSAGEDFEVFVPDDHFQNFVIQPQSGTVDTIPDRFGADELHAPEQESSTTIGLGPTNHNKLGLVYTGESIQSFRTMLKRYNLHSSFGTTDAINEKVRIYGRRFAYPYYRGYVAGAINETAAPAAYNFCNTVMLHWVTLAHSGWRGSIRWKIIPRYPEDSNIYVQRYPEGNDDLYHYSVTDLSHFPTYSAIAQTSVNSTTGNQVVPSGVRGATYANGIVNPIVEFEVPFYSRARFNPGKLENCTSTSTFGESFEFFAHFHGSGYSLTDLWCAAGEDYQTYFFTGLPPLYYESGPPAPRTV